MKQIGRYLFVVALFIIMHISSSFAQETLPLKPVQLQFKANKREQTLYTLQIQFSPLKKITGKQVYEISGFPFNRLFRFLIRQTVTDIDMDGQLHLSYSLESVSIGGSPDDSKAPIVEEVLASIRGKSLTLIISSSGKLSDVKGLEGIKDVNLEETLKAILTRLHPRFPLAPVPQGRKWQYDDIFDSKFNTPAGTFAMQNKVRTAYTLKGLENKTGYDCAKIKTDMTLAQVFSTALLPIELPFKISADIKGTGYGTIYFAPQEGKLISAVLSLVQHSDVALLPPHQTENNNSKNEFRQAFGAELETNIRIDIEPQQK